jgi:hypothetical protein
MNDESITVLKQVAVAMWHSLLGHCDDETERESLAILKASVECGCVPHPDAKAILRSIIRSSKKPA